MTNPYEAAVQAFLELGLPTPRFDIPQRDAFLRVMEAIIKITKTQNKLIEDVKELTKYALSETAIENLNAGKLG